LIIYFIIKKRRRETENKENVELTKNNEEKDNYRKAEPYSTSTMKFDSSTMETYDKMPNESVTKGDNTYVNVPKDEIPDENTNDSNYVNAPVNK